MNLTGVGAKLGMSGELQFKDKDGNVLKTVSFTGAIPLEKLDMSVEQAQQLISEQDNGPHDCE